MNNAAVGQAMYVCNGATPLSIACQQGHAEVASVLLAAGAAVDLARDTGDTPLYIACEKGH